MNALSASLRSKPPEKPSYPWGPAARNAAVAELVVALALLLFAENLVGFGRFLELFLGFPVSRVAIRMVFEGELAVGFLYLVNGRIPTDAENLVVVPFCHSSPDSPCAAKGIKNAV